MPAVLKNPLSMVHDYPTDIYQKAIDLGLVSELRNRKSRKFLRKRVLTIAVMGVLFGLAVYRFNGTDSFIAGAGYTHLLWTAVHCYDCIVLDWLRFCHSKRVVIPGTEELDGYMDYCFHPKSLLKGMLLGIPAAVAAGMVVAIIS